MKKILVIDESPLFRKYLKDKLEEYNFEVILGVNGLDGMVKMRSCIPDLIIMDYYLSRQSSLNVLQQKTENPNTAAVPVIMASNKIDKKKLLEIAKYNVKKFFNKPLKIDALLKGVSEFLDIKLELDTTPCIIEAHFNDEILFIEISRGLNQEKIELLKFKIIELLDLYKKQSPKILIILSDINLTKDDSGKLKSLLSTILETSRSPVKAVRILTSSAFIKEYIGDHEKFRMIEVTENLNQAMDGLLELKVSGFIDEGHKIVRDDFLTSSAPAKEGESIRLGMDDLGMDGSGMDGREARRIAKDIVIAAVDDDLVIQELIKTTFSKTGWQIKCFENGKKFTDSLADSTFDLVFLDMMMPEMNGLEVLQYLKARRIETPVIVLSALSQKETVAKAIGYGVKSYMIKPLKPDSILTKTAEILQMNF